MTQEEKQLLFKDLCARLPYGVKINYSTGPANHCIFTLTELNVKTSYDEQYDLHCYPKLNGIYNYFDCLPYLRPISSMTKEEENEFISLNAIPSPCELPNHTRMNWYSNATMLDWLNAHHFDYRNLIEKGLALEAPEGMYKEE